MNVRESLQAMATCTCLPHTCVSYLEREEGVFAVLSGAKKLIFICFGADLVKKWAKFAIFN